MMGGRRNLSPILLLNRRGLLMPRIEPLPRQVLTQFEPIFSGMDVTLGYVPNSFFTMGRDPGILKAVGGLMDALWYPTIVSEPVRRLVTFAYSWFAGSPYSAAHCACGAVELGLSLDKIQSVDDYENSQLYSEGERALIRLCDHSARIPSAVIDSDVKNLGKHFSEKEIVFITGMISMMAFLNRWNEIMKTTLEPVPLQWATENLPGFGEMMDLRAA
jgi:alkylhydroperoxidase family enzyme